MHVRHGLPHPYVVVPRVVVKHDTNTVHVLHRSEMTKSEGCLFGHRTHRTYPVEIPVELIYFLSLNFQDGSNYPTENG